MGRLSNQNILNNLWKTQKLNRQQVNILCKNIGVFEEMMYSGYKPITDKISQDVIDAKAQQYIHYNRVTVHIVDFISSVGYRLKPETIEQFLFSVYRQYILYNENIKIPSEAMDKLIDSLISANDIEKFKSNIRLIAYRHFRDLDRNQLKKIIKYLFSKGVRLYTIKSIMDEKIIIEAIEELKDE